MEQDSDLFTIFQVTADEAVEIAKEDIQPHRHDYEELLIGIEGQLEHFIDFRSETIEAPYISFVTRGKVHRLRPLLKDGRCQIWSLRFKSEFIADVAFRLYTDFHDKANMCFPCNGCFHRLDTLCQLIANEYAQTPPDLAVIRQLLSALIAMIESDRQRNMPEETSVKVQNVTFLNFLRLLDEHYREPVGVNFYAERLFMTVRNLNLICQKVLHQSVSELIEMRKLTAAKNLLITTDKTIAEIGYSLGFNEKTYFTHAFKRETGITPSDFRREMKKIVL